jgi:hypothetical protein
MMLLRYPCRLHAGVLLAGSLLAFGAHATSPQEETIFKAPAPHQLYKRGGQPVAVHRARMQGYLEGKQGNGAALAELTRQVQRCVADATRRGQPSNPPTSWPDYMLAERTDQYMAANRSIKYTSGVTYLVRYTDCSLIAEIVSTAQLVSSKGICEIDLVRKVARGSCDPGGHADALAEPRTVMPDRAELLKKLSANPAFAQSGGALRQALMMTPSKTGQQKTLLGIRCDVWSEPVLKGTRCYAGGGSFAPARSADNPVWAGLLLETDIPGGMKSTAVDAALDSEVNSAVFAPYAAGGYRIASSGAKR